jgi:NAD(P)-dependent dehydrogenase (short-subunit alcohol dehydrogenase family)
MELEGKVAHVTAAGAGIGRGIARRLADEGASVVVSDVEEESGAGTVDLIESEGGRGAFTRADAAKERDLQAALAFTVDTFGGLDVLVNNAGGAPEPYFPDAEPAHWLATVALNLHSAMLGTHYGIEAMKSRSGGSILLVSSMAGIGFAPHQLPEYAACKAALCRLTSTLAPISDEHGVRVNCICPDWVETERMRESRLEMGEEEWRRYGSEELVSVEEIAGVAFRLIVDESLAGRVMLCPVGGWPWGLIPLDEAPDVVPLRGFQRHA